jgi:hypothetical protein
MKKVTVNIVDGQGMPMQITVEVPDDATQKEIEEAVKRKLQSSS